MKQRLLITGKLKLYWIPGASETSKNKGTHRGHLIKNKDCWSHAGASGHPTLKWTLLLIIKYVKMTKK